jgi:DNA-binding response OmpR family regulator
VLVVDDDVNIRHLIAVNLELEGFDVTQVGDGQDCLDAAAISLPDVIVLDVSLPSLDGIKTTQRLRADPSTSGIRIVMVSAKAQQSDVRRGLSSGADAYLTKPFDPEVLVRVVRELVAAPVPDAAGPAPR